MYLSLNWLKDFVDIPKGLDPKDLGLKLTMATMEIEDVKQQSVGLEDVVVGELIEKKKHSNADRLFVGKVNIGKKSIQVVFADKAEVEVGDRVPVAVAPTLLPTGIEIKKGKFRGEKSEGMLCLDSEMFLDAPEELTKFSKDIKPGQSIIKVLGLDDVLLEIDNKSITHRPDLWGHYGVAREISALYKKKLKEYPITDYKEGKEVDLKVKIDNQYLCPRFMAVVVGNIKIEPSPKWMQKRLQAVGIRPINNIVDITNYVMVELGQPMHAYDRKLINGDYLGTRLAKEGEKFTTLDGEVRILTKDDLLNIDKTGPVGLAGIMGGENSEISDRTTEVILESANWNPVTVRKTATRLGLRTDALQRFEKSLDPHWPELAIKRALGLIEEFIPSAKVISKVVDKVRLPKYVSIALRKDYLSTKMGIELAYQEVVNILERLGFQVNFSKDVYNVIVPTWRATRDIYIADDLVEEISRIYGYDNIPTKLPTRDITPPEINLGRKVERKVKNILVYGCGFNEVYNYSFVNEKQLDNIGIDYSKHIRINNPLSSDQTMLRQSLIPNLIKNVEENLRFFDNFKIFEIEQVFLPEYKGYHKDKLKKDKLPLQPRYVSGIIVDKNIETSFFEVKGVVEKIFKELNIEVKFKESSDLPGWAHPLRSLTVIVNGKKVGLITELNPRISNLLDIKALCGVFDLNFEKSVKDYTDAIVYSPVPKYPSIILDISMLVHQRILWQKINDLIMKKGKNLLVGVELFDVYTGKGVPEGKKSLAFHLTYQNKNKTLELEEVQNINNAIQDALVKQFKAEIRK